MTRKPLFDIQASPTAGPQVDVIRLAAGLISVSIIIAALYVGQGVLIPLAIAFLISFALGPLVNWLSRRGVPRILSVCIVMVTVGAVIAGIGLLVTTQLRTLSAQLPSYQTTIRDKIENLAEQMKGPGIFDGVIETFTTVQTQVNAVVQSEDGEVGIQEVKIVPPPISPLETAKNWLVPALAPLATIGIVLVFVFLTLLDSGDLRDRLIRLMGGNLHRSTDALKEAGQRISRYLLMQILVNTLYSIPLGFGLWLIGVPGWLLWAVLATFMRFIPYVGPMLSAIFPIALAFAVDPGWSMVLWTVGMIVTLEAISGNILEPLLYGTTTGLSAISLIAAATFWTALWGPVGLILSTPLTVCLLVVGRYLPQLNFLETILGSAPVLDVPTRIYQRLLAGDAYDAIDLVDKTVKESSVAQFYNDQGIEVLRLAGADYFSHARPEHRLRVQNGMDAVLDDLREEYPAPESNEPARVACIGGKWEIDSVASEMLAHALNLDGFPAITRREEVVTARYVDKLELDGIDVICLSYFDREPESAIRTICRRLRHRWPDRQIVLTLLNAPEALLDPERVKALGADEVVTSIEEARHRIHRILAPDEALQAQIAPAPDNDAQRIKVLQASEVLDGRAREQLDALAKRAANVFSVKFAVISAIDAEEEYIIGQSIELPGKRTRDGTDMIVMPRDEAICDHVVASGKTLIVNDTERDPRFADHPAIMLWNTRFYAGSPLKTADGLVLGALCLLDVEPRKLTADEVLLLDEMASNVVSVIAGEEVASQAEKKAEPTTTTGQIVP